LQESNEKAKEKSRQNRPAKRVFKAFLLTFRRELFIIRRRFSTVGGVGWIGRRSAVRSKGKLLPFLNSLIFERLSGAFVEALVNR
jgi:hypothetical protein